MRIDISPNEPDAAVVAASEVSVSAKLCIGARGRFLCALSGGRTPWNMLRLLAAESLPWKQIFFIQVDERIAPDGDPDRNLTHIHECLPNVPREQIIAMPVASMEPEQAAAAYERTLHALCGEPVILDLVCLGLGTDGHTASLIPGDPVLDVKDVDVAATGVYQGRRRVTLTYPILNRARKVVWLVTGAEKKAALAKLMAADQTIPAGRVSQAHARVYADADAAR